MLLGGRHISDQEVFLLISILYAFRSARELRTQQFLTWREVRPKNS